MMNGALHSHREHKYYDHHKKNTNDMETSSSWIVRSLMQRGNVAISAIRKTAKEEKRRKEFGAVLER